MIRSLQVVKSEPEIPSNHGSKLVWRGGDGERGAHWRGQGTDVLSSRRSGPTQVVPSQGVLCELTLATES